MRSFRYGSQPQERTGTQALGAGMGEAEIFLVWDCTLCRTVWAVSSHGLSFFGNLFVSSSMVMPWERLAIEAGLNYLLLLG